MEKSRLLGAVCAFFIATFGCNAALIDHGTYLEDTNTDLFWLKLTETADLTYNEVIAMSGTSGSLHGWILPTWNQARDFYKSNFGLDLEGADFSPTDAERQKIALLNSYMGDLMVDRGLPRQYSGSQAFIFPQSQINTYLYNYGANMSDDSTSFINTNNSYPWVGALLFRADAPIVPIPPSVWLFGSGLLGLIGIARRKKTN